jgi:hypothetical protein
MGKPKQSGYWDLRKFMGQLRNLTEGLPTDAQKTVIREHFEKIISFLNQTEKALDALPSAEEAVNVKKAIEGLDEMAMKAKSDPILSAALGFALPRAPRPKALALSGEENASAQNLLDELRAHSVDDMHARLARR